MSDAVQRLQNYLSIWSGTYHADNIAAVLAELFQVQKELEELIRQIREHDIPGRDLEGDGR